MESLDEMSKNKNSFFKHVFNFDDESKNEMSNIIQYAVLAIIPVIVLNKLMQKYVPEADEDKNSIELTAEVVAQLVMMFLFMMIIHRIITYIPTYSGEKYATFSVTNIILSMMVIILSLHTKLGDKVSILVDRLIEMWEGPKKESNKKGKVTVSQPLSGSLSIPMAGTTSLSSLKNDASDSSGQIPQMQQNSPLLMDNFEPQPANGAFGSAFGGAW